MGQWVKYQNRRNGHVGIVSREDFNKALRKTRMLRIIEVYDNKPGSNEEKADKTKKKEAVKDVPKPDAVAEAEENQKNKEEIEKKKTKKINQKNE